jgi:predicted tellurium resistance membrane protein TerC
MDLPSLLPYLRRPVARIGLGAVAVIASFYVAKLAPVDNPDFSFLMVVGPVIALIGYICAIELWAFVTSVRNKSIVLAALLFVIFVGIFYCVGASHKGQANLITNYLICAAVLSNCLCLGAIIGMPAAREPSNSAPQPKKARKTKDS